MDRAAKLFKQAGCVQSDIKAALTSHIKHDEIDIPQDEPEEAKKVMLLSLVLPILLLRQCACLDIGDMSICPVSELSKKASCKHEHVSGRSKVCYMHIKMLLLRCSSILNHECAVVLRHSKWWDRRSQTLH